VGYDRPSAARFSFLLAVPAVFGAGLYETYTALTAETCPPDPSRADYGMPETVAATVVAFVVGLAVIAFLMKWISTRSFLPFVIYRVALGVALIVLLLTGTLDASAPTAVDCSGDSTTG